MPKCQLSDFGPVYEAPPLELKELSEILYDYLYVQHTRVFGSPVDVTGAETSGDLDVKNVALNHQDTKTRSNYDHHGVGEHEDLDQATGNADATASAVTVTSADAPETTSSDAPETTSADAATQGGAYDQADVQSIATLANELKADYNTARTLVNELKEDYNTARTLVNELKTDVGAVVTDLNAVVTKLNAVLASLRTAKLMAE